MFTRISKLYFSRISEINPLTHIYSWPTGDLIMSQVDPSNLGQFDAILRGWNCQWLVQLGRLLDQCYGRVGIWPWKAYGQFMGSSWILIKEHRGCRSNVGVLICQVRYLLNFVGVVVLGSNALTARREHITIFDRDDAHALHKATLIFDYLICRQTVECFNVCVF